MMEKVEQLGIRPQSVGADKAYGSGEFLAWLLARGVQPHIPVIDRRHQTEGRFTRDRFRYEPAENAAPSMIARNCTLYSRVLKKNPRRSHFPSLGTLSSEQVRLFQRTEQCAAKRLLECD
jgi:hypothetical protein